jgi:hypothetical protein
MLRDRARRRILPSMVLPVFCLLLLANGISHLNPNHSYEPDREMALMCKLAAWSLIALRALVYVRQTLALW